MSYYHAEFDRMHGDPTYFHRNPDPPEPVDLCDCGEPADPESEIGFCAACDRECTGADREFALRVRAVNQKMRREF